MGYHRKGNEEYCSGAYYGEQKAERSLSVSHFSLSLSLSLSPSVSLPPFSIPSRPGPYACLYTFLGLGIEPCHRQIVLLLAERTRARTRAHALSTFQNKPKTFIRVTEIKEMITQ